MLNKVPLLYCNNYSYIIGGVEFFNKNLELAFEEKKLKYEAIYKVNYFKNFSTTRELVSLFKLIIISRKLKYDFLLLHHSNFFSILILPFLSLFFKDIRTLCHVGSEWKHIKKKYLRKITILFLKKYTFKSFVISDSQINFLNGVKTEKINSIIPKNFIKTPYNLESESENYILFLSRVCKEKGLFDILRLYKKNYKKLPKIKICGPVENEKTRIFINKIIKKCGTKIELLDPVYDVDKKIKLIDNSIFGIYPSYYDAFPLTPIEFFSRKKICITSNISESVNFIKEKKLLITPGNLREIEMAILFTLDTIKNQTFNSDINKTIDTAKKIAEGKIVNIITK